MTSTIIQSDRHSNGRFAAGNPGGPGNPHAARVSQLRSALFDAVTEVDIREVVQALVKEAKDGNVQAARELLDRCLGKASQAIQIDCALKEHADDPIDVNDSERMSEMLDEMEAGGVEPPPAFRLHVEQLRKQRADSELMANH